MLGRSAAIFSMLALAVGVLLAEPKPARVSPAWQLEFRFDDPKRLEIKLPGEDKPRVYWYMLYTAVNNSGRDVQFLPTFEIVTDRIQIVPAEPAADPAVFDAIKRMYLKTRPLLLEPLEAVGKLLQGEDNAKESVAIWPDFALKGGKFNVFLGGLSGETVIVKNPNYDPVWPEYEVRKLPDGQEIRIMVNPKRFILRKSLQIEYRLPGDEHAREQSKCVRQKVRWLMR